MNFGLAGNFEYWHWSLYWFGDETGCINIEVVDLAVLEVKAIINDGVMVFGRLRAYYATIALNFISILR